MERARTVSGGGGTLPPPIASTTTTTSAIHKDKEEEEDNRSAAEDADAGAADAGDGHVSCINGSVCDIACDVFLAPVLLQPPGKSDVVMGRVYSQWWRRTRQTSPSWWDALAQQAAARSQ
jgi:hypothetical protein